MESVNVDSSKFLPKGVKLSESCSDPALLKMLEEGLLADITLTAEGGSVMIKAHRSELASVSPVFCAMFQHNMKEKLTSKVDFFDMTIDALQLFLLLLYTTNEEDTRPQKMQPHFNDAMDKHFVEIIEAARKYQVGSRLKYVLQSGLLRNLKPENCWYCLDCSKEIWKSKSNGAYMHSCYQTCYYYILKNYDKVVGSESFLLEMQRKPGRVYGVILANSRGK